jgi:hypothetical protein
MRVWLKERLLPLLYRRPIPELPAERLYLYLDVLWRTRTLEGAVVEVGCFQCGTAAWAMQMLRGIDAKREYVCIDTFGGFVAAQFAHDVRLGTAASRRSGFQANSRALVERLVRHWGVPEIELVQADIATLSAEALPARIIAGLVDVDLEQPTYHALTKMYPRLVQGGTILVDDCSPHPDNPFRGARLGYERFLMELGLTARYELGMGVVTRKSPAHEIESVDLRPGD